MQNPVLNPQQKKAVEHGTGPLLIIAGAGTGKTTVITERIKHLLLSKKITPENIVALTFTEKAALEMQDRVDSAMPYGYGDMWIHTFHAFCDRILRVESLHIGLSPNYQLLTTAQTILFLQKHVFDFNLNYFRPLGKPDKFLQGLLQHFSRLKDEDITPKEYLKFAAGKHESEDQEMLQELANAYATYEALKVKENVMDFADLISNTLLLFRKRPHILEKYQKQFTYILIDEFQDTNFAQNQLALLLSGKTKNITVVGDDDQSIYRWRGAAVSNMMQFRENFPDVSIVTLTKNYRSTQTILDTAYKVIQQNNPDRLEVKEKIDKHLLSAKKDSVQHEVVFMHEERDDLEAEKVITKIEELHTKGYAYKDFAILVRANDHAAPFLRSLIRHQLPHQFLGPGKLFHQEEIKDLIAYLKVLYNHEDAQSLYRVLTMPIFAISANDISLLLQQSKKDSKNLFDVVHNSQDYTLSENGKKGVEKIVTLLTKHSEMVPKESAGKILYDFLQHAGIIRSYLDIKTEDDDIKAQNTSKFFEKLKQFEIQNDDASVYSVVDWIDLSMQLGESPLATEVDWSNQDAINILTIHSSKGLEFPIVFIVNLVAQRFPSRQRAEQIPLPEEIIKEILPSGDYHLQEERRLFYVALTRAKEYVFLTAASIYNDGKPRKISPFIFESLGDGIPTNILPTKVPLQEIYPKNETLAVKAKAPFVVNYLSYSRIQAFDICPLHYKLRYILNIPTPPQPALSFGTSVHAALKEFYSKALQGEVVGVKDIPQILESVWITEGYTGQSHREAAFTGAQHLLTTYIEKNFTTKALPLVLEFPFQFHIGNLKIGGRMDRVDKHADGSIEIIDYKTGRNALIEKTIKNNVQLAIYALAAQCLPNILVNGKLPPITISLHFLESGEKVSTIVSLDAMQKASDKLIAKAKEIEESDFACSKSIFCEDCEYVMLCQAKL